MAVSAKSAAVFVIDCAYTMSLARPFTQGHGSDRRETSTTPIDVAKRYVKAKIVQRMIRELKTTPIIVLLYGVPKTKNILTARSKESGKYDKHDDLYRYMYELVGAEFAPGMHTLAQIDGIIAGEGPDAEEGSDWSADAHSAIILAMETIESIPKTAKFSRDIYLLTDGESASDWDRWQDTVERMNGRNMALTVVGFNFDDEDYDFVEQDKSTIKRTNEEHFRKMVEGLDEPSICATMARALDSIASPVIKEVKSQKAGMLLTLGDNERFPDRSLSIHIEVSKAVSAAPLKSMAKMSLQSFPSISSGYNKRPRDVDQMDEDAEAGPSTSTSKRIETDAQNQSKSGRDAKAPNVKYTMGHLGRTLDKLLEMENLATDGYENSHTVTIERRYHYKAMNDPAEAKREKETEAKGKGKDGERQDERERIKELPLAPEDHLALGYYYGGDIVPAEDLSDGAGTLSGLVQGMMITGFMKQSEARLDWRIGDALFVTAAVGQIGSEHLFSALINAMTERKACAIARYVGKPWTESKTGTLKFPEPRLGLLWPSIEETDDGVIELCYWIRMPFAEDMRQIVFPSLDIIYGLSGVVLKEHSNLPTTAQQDAMDDFVDAMDISKAGPEDGEGRPTHWFSIKESYSPAIHNVNNALVFRLSNPEGELPPVCSHLTKYLDPPEHVVQQAREAIEHAIKTLDVHAAPPKPTKIHRGAKGQSNETADVDYDPSAELLGGKRSASQKPSGQLRVHENEREMLPGAPGPLKRVVTQVKSQSQSQTKDAIDEDASMNSGEVHGIKMEPSSNKARSALEDVEMVGSEAEPDTEDEDADNEPTTASRLAIAPATLSTANLEFDFDSVADVSGMRRALDLLRDKVEGLVRSSFSTQHYNKCIRALKRAQIRAREVRMRDEEERWRVAYFALSSFSSQQGDADAYDDMVRQLVSKFRADPDKLDFVEWVKKHEL
ncbi:ATP-dependent DNA helicase yku80 [Microbotryomycetes sp. JL201]|nr:ATP-dependent DNA helicase yku80 [Microbotryomycetes sp. JL201]